MTRNKPIPHTDPADAAYIRGLLIHEDMSVLVFNKPSGFAVQGGGGVDRSLDQLLSVFAKSNGKKPKLVHRLDRGTSGIVLAGRSHPAAAFFAAQFESRQAKKTYYAIVRGDVPKKESGFIDAHLLKVTEGGRPRMIVAKPDRKGAQQSLTGWSVVARAGDAALMELSPKTGRMHQLRVHLMHLGCPIIGDYIYGRAEPGRMMLHAAKLEIAHPEKGQVSFEAQIPDDMKAEIEKLSLQSGL